MFTYVANWKMAVSYEHAQRLAAEFEQQPLLLKDSLDKFILCPSFPALNLFGKLAQENRILLGAQDCSPYLNGAYTGDVDALSLKQVGCTYCIVGHSERRNLHHETPELIAQKVSQLQLNQITPIVCVGETAEEKENGLTLRALQHQLQPVLTVSAATQGPLIIAYEPVWAIGSGAQPTHEEITSIIDSIQAYSVTILNSPVPVFYGGSVNATTIHALKKIPALDGVLIGSASTDFHSLQKIVS